MATSILLGSILLMATVIWNAVSTVVVACTPKGDYAKACACCVLGHRPHQFAEPPLPPAQSPAVRRIIAYS